MQTAVVQLCHHLTGPIRPQPVAGVRLRNFSGAEDIDHWLDVRHRAFARLKLGVRRWDRGDFQRELLDKSWWQPRRLWLAEGRAMLGNWQPVGTVIWGQRGEGPAAKAVVHWLAVVPSWRRRGVGRLLVQTLEAACWEAGHRQVWLETHTAWESALRLYESLGYRRAADADLPPAAGTSEKPD